MQDKQQQTAKSKFHTHRSVGESVHYFCKCSTTVKRRQ